MILTNFDKINSVEDFCKFGNVTINQAKFILIQDEKLCKLKNLISEDEKKELFSLELIENVSNVEILRVGSDNEGTVNTLISYIDEKNRTRFAIFEDDLFAPGAALYSSDSDSAKNDLVFKINDYYKHIIAAYLEDDVCNDCRCKDHEVNPLLN